MWVENCFIILICSIYFIVRLLVFCITKCLKPPIKTLAMVAWRVKMTHHTTASSPHWILYPIIVIGMGLFVSFLTLEDKAFRHWVSCGLSYSSYDVEVSSFYTCFVENFYHQWMLNFITCFFSIYWDDHVFILGFVDVLNHIVLLMLNHPCTPSINPTWSWCISLLMYCWFQFASTLLRIFPCLSGILACNTLFHSIFFWF